jgi:hypothetical protein
MNQINKLKKSALSIVTAVKASNPTSQTVQIAKSNIPGDISTYTPVLRVRPRRSPLPQMVKLVSDARKTNSLRTLLAMRTY